MQSSSQKSISATFKNPRDLIDYINWCRTNPFLSSYVITSITYKVGWFYVYYTVILQKQNDQINIEVQSVSLKPGTVENKLVNHS